MEILPFQQVINILLETMGPEGILWYLLEGKTRQSAINRL
jgi:hypothetical protein